MSPSVLDSCARCRAVLLNATGVPELAAAVPLAWGFLAPWPARVASVVLCSEPLTKGRLTFKVMLRHESDNNAYTAFAPDSLGCAGQDSAAWRILQHDLHRVGVEDGSGNHLT